MEHTNGYVESCYPALNVTSIWKCEEGVLHAPSGATPSGNRNSTVTKYSDVSLIVEHLMKDSVFKKQLSRRGSRKNGFSSELPDLFSKEECHVSLYGIAMACKFLQSRSIPNLFTCSPPTSQPFLRSKSLDSNVTNTCWS